MPHVLPTNGTHAPALLREADLSTPQYVCGLPTHRRCTCVRPVYTAHTGLHTLPCPTVGCGATFLTSTDLAAHHLAQHERAWPDGLSGSDRGVQPGEGGESHAHESAH